MKTLDRIRVIGFIVIALAAIVVVLTIDESTSGADARAAVRQALADADLNEVSAESAPQQQVVNGWTARDLLAAVGRAQADELDRAGDPRLPILLTLAVIAVCWLGITKPSDAVTMTQVTGA